MNDISLAVSIGSLKLENPV
ncbi:MAG: hypothetical protein Q4D17_03025, partial [Planctomycetia bacterium]|nr:hypothetical protein [Planctomycetia bacterium]